MGSTIVITGCSTGFGRQAAEKVARRGHRVYATMRGVASKNKQAAGELESMAQRENLDLRVMELDVTCSASVDAAAARVLADSGPPDVVVNNAGQMFVGITELFSAEELSRQLEINVVGPHRVSRAFLQPMRRRGEGLIINISSVAGRLSIPFFGVYHASKWGLEGYSQSLRAELASSGIDVVVVEPGPFSTELFGRSPQPEDRDLRGKDYAPAVHDALEQVNAAFEGVFESSQAPTDPEMVVDRIIELIDMRPGSRPFRSVVGVDFGVTGMNRSVEAFEAGVIESLGLKDFTTIGSPGGGAN